MKRLPKLTIEFLQLNEAELGDSVRIKNSNAKPSDKQSIRKLP